METSAQAAEPITDPLVLETAAGADTQMMSAEETANKNYGEAQLVSVNKDSGTEFFESARLTRSKARDEALDTLKKVPEGHQADQRGEGAADDPAE